MSLAADAQRAGVVEDVEQHVLQEQNHPQADAQAQALDGHAGDDSAGEPPRLARQIVPGQQNAHRQDRQHKMLAETEQFQQPAEKGIGPVLDPQQQDPRLVGDQQGGEEHQAGQRPPGFDPILLGQVAGRDMFGRRSPFSSFSTRTVAPLEPQRPAAT